MKFLLISFYLIYKKLKSEFFTLGFYDVIEKKKDEKEIFKNDEFIMKLFPTFDNFVMKF